MTPTGQDGRCPSRPLRDQAHEIFAAALRAADPRTRVLESLAISGRGGPILAGEELAPGARLGVVALGKAAVSMAEAAVQALSTEVFPGPGVVVVDHANAREVPRFRVHSAGHPIPDAAGLAAAHDVTRYVAGAAAGDALLVLISGGGSALLPAPAQGISLEDKQEVTRQLLACGADIHELNTVRKHLSRLKGGGLARLAAPARVEALVLSDVVGDDLGTIAGGPTAPDPSTFADARRILDQYGIAEAAPEPVVRRLAEGAVGAIAETTGDGDPILDRVANRIIGGNGMSLDAAAREAHSLGFQVEILSRELVGEARSVAGRIAGRLGDLGGGQPVALLAGGETTVTLRGSGRGGRNQEMAAAVAMALDELPETPPDWAFLSGATDGRDGPTEAAGGLVDPGTVARCVAAGLDFAGELDDNNSHALLRASGDLLLTGPTGTNVADLQILLLAGA